MMKEKMLSTSEAAKALGIDRSRVSRLIKSGKLPAIKIGSYWAIAEKDLDIVKDRKRGYPKGKKRKP
jgi:excisionase family DNA binding protein